MKCVKCKEDVTVKWISGETYKGIDEHHNPPEFLSDYLKENWSGEKYYICRDCHDKLHKEIRKILNKFAGTLKFVDSDYWILKKMNLLQIQESKKIIYDFTKKWLEVQKDGDITTTRKP